MNKDIKIVVVCGGVSSEREVSLKSGNAVFAALLRSGFNCTELFDLNESNLDELIAKKPDLAYLALHGEGGEDGRIQGALDLAGICYTGPGAETSAVCMNKVLTKYVMSTFGVPTARFLVYNLWENVSYEEMAKSIIEKLGLPVVLKSPSQGSSIGVVIVREKEKMLSAIEEIFTFGDTLLAEEYLSGVEITVPILGNRDLLVLPEVEITTDNEFYDFNAKYTSGKCRHIIPSSIKENERKEVFTIAKRLYKTLGCKGLSRIDFIVDKNKGPMVIEVNTLPGMTEMSLFPDSARYAGIEFEELVTRIAELGFEN